VEGVARRIDPNNDIWAAAKPVVERWIARELSPVRRFRDLADQGVRAVEGLARWAETPSPPPAVIVARKASNVAWIALAVGAVGIAAAVYDLATR